MAVSTGPRVNDEFALTVYDPQDFVEVAASRGRVRDGQTNDLFGVDDEYRPDGERNTLGIDVGNVLMVQHIVQVGDLTVLVGDLEK